MGKVKEKLQEISELIQAQLDSGVDMEELDSYMELELSLADYAFYLENKDTILNFFEGLKIKGKMLAETQHFERGLDPKEAMKTGSYAIQKVKATCPGCHEVQNYTDRDVISWTPKRSLNPYNYYVRCPYCRTGFTIKTHTKLHESHDFKRGLDPKDAMGTGDIELRREERIARKIKAKASELKAKCKNINDVGLYLDDDLMTNYQSYHDSKLEKIHVDRLATVMMERHPNESPEYIVDYVYGWCDVNIDDVNESFYPTLFESYWDGNDDDEEEENDNNVPEAREEAPRLYYNQEGNYQKEYEYYWKKLIPMFRNSDTIQGEMLRCLSSILHDRYNNGFGNDRKDEAQQLLKYAGKFEPYLKHPNIFKVFYRYYHDINYGRNRYVENNWIADKYFDPIMDAILKYIMNSETFEPLPEEDKFYNS